MEVMLLANLRRLSKNKYKVEYDERCDGIGPDYYIIKGRIGFIQPHFREDSITVAVFPKFFRAKAVLNNIGIWMITKNDAIYYEVDARDFDLAAELIEAFDK